MVLSRIRRVFSSKVARNAAALYAVQILGYLLPLITLPYLARVLGPYHFGLVAFGQSLALWVSVVGEYGFDFSATRSIARIRGRADAVAAVVMSVMGAKTLLMLAMVIITLACALLVPLLRDHPEIALWALLMSLFGVYRPLWYFQGLERAWVIALLDGAGRVVSLVGIFVFVKQPEDAWMVLALQAGGYAFASVAGMILMYREVPFRLPTLWLSWVALKVSFNLFTARASSSLYSSANTFILGVLTSPIQVSHYAPGERLITPALSMIWPLAQVIYPRINNLMSRDPQAAMRWSRLSLLATTGMGLLASLTLIALAPWLVGLLFPGFEDAVPVLRVLALLLPIVGFSYSLSMQYMFPRGMDRMVAASVMVAGVVNVLLALILAPLYGALGMAVAVVSAELSAAVVRFWVLRVRKIL